MKVRVFLISWVLFFSNPALAVQNGAELFETLCMTCHVTEGPPTIAPPVFGVINHVKSAYPSRDEFVQRIVRWVNKPNAQDALMPGAVRKFGLMPDLSYSEYDVRLIAEYLYDGKTELPEWYIEHYKQEHGEAPTQ